MGAFALDHSRIGIHRIDGIHDLSGFILFLEYTVLCSFCLIAESVEYSLPRIRGMAKFGKVFILMEKEELCSFGN